LHRTHKAYGQQCNNIFDESCQWDSTRGPNVSHLHYDDYYYSFITDLFDGAVNRSDYVEFSNMIVELEYMCLEYHSSICLLRLKELRKDLNI
jgi:hypothetical protein